MPRDAGDDEESDVGEEPGQDVSAAAACPRTFTLLAEGGVRVRWACGAEYVSKSEDAVDVDVLSANLPTHHRHHRPSKR